MKFDFKSQDDEIRNSDLLQLNLRAKNVKGKKKKKVEMQWRHFWRAFREKVCFSLRSREIGPLDFDGARRENVLRGAATRGPRICGVSSNSKK